MNAIAFTRRCEPLRRASKDDGPSVADSSFEARKGAHLRMTENTPSRSRGADRPRFAFISSPSPIQRAQGMPDARCTRGLMRKLVESARMSIQGSGEHPASPAQWLYGL